MIIRAAVSGDAAEIHAMLIEMWQEHGLGTLDPVMVLNKINNLIAHHVILIAQDDDANLTGSMGIEFTQWWWSGDRIGSEQWTFVRKDYRKTRSAVMLLKEADRMGKEMQIPMVIGVFTPNDAERKEKFFKRLGLHVGTIVLAGDLSLAWGAK